jgi:hypothetical protein
MCFAIWMEPITYMAIKYPAPICERCGQLMLTVTPSIIERNPNHSRSFRIDASAAVAHSATDAEALSERTQKDREANLIGLIGSANRMIGWQASAP